MKRLFVALCAASMLLPMAGANAGSYGVDVVSVKTDDLDLSNTTGQATLHARIAMAANAVCGIGVDRIHLLLAAKARACRADVIASYAPKVAALTGHAGPGPVRLAAN